MLLLKNFWRPSATIFGTPLAFEGVTLLLNTAMTLVGMYAGSAGGRHGSEAVRAEEFFRELDRPVRLQEKQHGAVNSGPILQVATLAVAALLALAGCVSHAPAARWIDGGATLLLLGVAWLMRRSGRRSTMHDNATG
jgi:hypothetical protein